MSSDSGLSKPFIIFLLLLVSPLILYMIWSVQHSISANSQINELKDEVQAMSIPGSLADTTCSTGDGLDSLPSCTFLYEGSNLNGAQSAIEAAGYKNSKDSSKPNKTGYISYSKNPTVRSNSIRLSSPKAGSVKLEIYK